MTRGEKEKKKKEQLKQMMTLERKQKGSRISCNSIIIFEVANTYVGQVYRTK